MSLPWGVKEMVEPEQGDAVKTFITGTIGQAITLPSGYVLEVLKGDVKERKGSYILIARYQLTTLV